MAFAVHAAPRPRGMQAGDRAVLYVTRGAFHNPTRDGARLAGVVEVVSGPRAVDPTPIAGRDFTWLVAFRPLRVLPERSGPGVRALVPRLTFINRPAAWGHYLRTSPIRLPASDFDILAAAVEAWPEH